MREKIKWLSIIEYYDLIDDFDIYRFAHREISLNRCARAFVRKHNLDVNIEVRKQVFIEPASDDGTFDSPSMKEARSKIFDSWHMKIL